MVQEKWKAAQNRLVGIAKSKCRSHVKSKLLLSLLSLSVEIAISWYYNQKKICVYDKIFNQFHRLHNLLQFHISSLGGGGNMVSLCADVCV
jgi:hypothetical protein